MVRPAYQLVEEIRGSLEKRIGNNMDYIAEELSRADPRLSSRQQAAIDIKKNICEGDLFRRLKPLSKSGEQRQLRRLAYLFEILKVPYDDSIVQKTKDVNSDFKYPLE
jgi:hypothetical protein|tara:strand:+ start:948 stop:1271 length:324 start_codon:yes stop_codon:yes gene_type:complete